MLKIDKVLTEYFGNDDDILEGLKSKYEELVSNNKLPENSIVDRTDSTIRTVMSALIPVADVTSVESTVVNGDIFVSDGKR